MLPRAKEQENELDKKIEDATKDLEAISIIDNKEYFKPLSVLIVEDNNVISFKVKKYFLNLGCDKDKVEIVTTCGEALKRYQSNHYDIVYLDNRLTDTVIVDNDKLSNTGAELAIKMSEIDQQRANENQGDQLYPIKFSCSDDAQYANGSVAFEGVNFGMPKSFSLPDLKKALSNIFSEQKNTLGKRPVKGANASVINLPKQLLHSYFSVSSLSPQESTPSQTRIPQRATSEQSLVTLEKESKGLSTFGFFPANDPVNPNPGEEKRGEFSAPLSQA